MIGVTYGTVERTTLKKTIRAIGRVDFDERRLTDVTFKIGGWVQDLFVDYTGRRVRKGEPLLTLYSPDLVTSQEEYLLALRTRDQLAQSSLPEARNGSQGLVEAARRRLAALGPHPAANQSPGRARRAADVSDPFCSSLGDSRGENGGERHAGGTGDETLPHRRSLHRLAVCGHLRV